MGALAKTAKLGLERLLLGSMDLDAKFASNADIVDAAIGGKLLTFTATFDPPSLADAAQSAIQTIAAVGVALGDYVDAVSFSLNTQGLQVQAWISAADVISYRFRNQTGGTIDLASGTVSVRVRKA